MICGVVSGGADVIDPCAESTSRHAAPARHSYCGFNPICFAILA